MQSHPKQVLSDEQIAKLWKEAQHGLSYSVTETNLARFARAIESATLQAAGAAEAVVPLTWYDGAPPFPQDQEWFIAETTYGDRVCLVSLDEGREHKGNYAFKTADETYLKAELVKRWMQFPDCDYLPPAAPTSPAAPVEPSSLGAPASPSGSTLQQPSAASASIPSAVAEVRRNTKGGMAYIVPLVPPEQLIDGLLLFAKGEGQ